MCSMVKSVDFPSNLEMISTAAFQNCMNLREIDLSSTMVEIIGCCAFLEDNIFSVKFPSTLKIIESDAFMSTDIIEVNFSSKLSQVMTNVFSNCRFLKTADLMRTQLTYLPFQMFFNTGFEVVYFPRNLIAADREAFCNSYQIKEVYYCGNSPPLGQRCFPDSMMNIKVYVNEKATFDMFYDLPVIKNCLACSIIIPSETSTESSNADFTENASKEFTSIPDKEKMTKSTSENQAEEKKQKYVVTIPKIHVVTFIH